MNETTTAAVKPCTIIQHIQLSLESISQDNSFESAIDVLENIARDCAREHKIGEDGTVEHPDELLIDIKKLQAEQLEDARLAHWTV